MRRVRTLRRLGLRETAARVGISAAYLSRLETNQEKSPPAERVIRELAQTLEDEFLVLMHLAGRIPADVADYVTAEPAIPAFLRTARELNYTGEDLMRLLEQDAKERP